MVCAAGADNAEPGEKCWRIDHFASNRLSHSFFQPVSQAWGEDTCSCEQQFLTHHGGGALEVDGIDEEDFFRRRASLHWLPGCALPWHMHHS